MSEVAEAVGFNDQKYFQKSLKRSVVSLRQNIKRRTIDELKKILYILVAVTTFVLGALYAGFLE